MDALKILPVDWIVAAVFLLAVIALGIFKGRTPAGQKATSASYFLAGRGLKWWLIGISLIAANISSEQMVGMSGQAADYLGLAIASYEWMAAAALVVVAFFFLPYFLKTGIFTIPQFLEHRYNGTARTIMATFTMIILIGVSLTGVIYAGALTMSELFAGASLFGIALDLHFWCWFSGLVAAVYVFIGGLKASAWADFIMGLSLVAASAIIAYLAIRQLGITPVAELTAGCANPKDVADGAGGFSKLVALNHEKLNMFLPRGDKNIPWTALLIGLWIPNFYYWGLNQYITQRVLGSASLREGQKGIMLAATLKLLIPFIIVIPGIIAFNLYSGGLAESYERVNQRLITRHIDSATTSTVFVVQDAWRAENPGQAAKLDAHNTTVKARVGDDSKLASEEIRKGHKFDASLNLLIKNLIPSGSGLIGFILAALLGAIISSLAAVLNASSTIFTMDIFQKHIRPDASQTTLVTVGRMSVLVFALIGCVVSPMLDKLGSIFAYIQEFQGYVSPGILAVFVFGLINRRAPGAAGVVGLLLNPLLYFLFATFCPQLSFLDRMAVCFFSVMAIMWVIGMAKPLAQPVEFKNAATIDVESSKGARIYGVILLVLIAGLYVLFSPIGVA